MVKNYLSVIAQILATFWALWLPPVKYGIYFHRRISTINIPVDKSSYKNSEKVYIIITLTYHFYNNRKKINVYGVALFPFLAGENRITI